MAGWALVAAALGWDFWKERRDPEGTMTGVFRNMPDYMKPPLFGFWAWVGFHLFFQHILEENND